MQKKLLKPFAWGLIMALCGCASVGDYFSDRGEDLMDPFVLNFSGGPGFGLGVTYGLSSFGSADLDVEKAGLNGRRFGYWLERQSQKAFLPFSLIALPLDWAKSGSTDTNWEDPKVYDYIWGKDDQVMVSGWVTNQDVTVRHYRAVPFWRPAPYGEGLPSSWGDAYPISFTAHYKVGVQAGVYPLQFLDFALGLFGIDFAADDDVVQSKGSKEEKEPQGKTP